MPSIAFMTFLLKFSVFHTFPVPFSQLGLTIPVSCFPRANLVVLISKKEGNNGTCHSAMYVWALAGEQRPFFHALGQSKPIDFILEHQDHLIWVVGSEQWMNERIIQIQCVYSKGGN